MPTGGAAAGVTMPQAKRGSRDAGLHMPGIYQALLEYERERYCRRGEATIINGRELRVSWADKDDHSQGFFLWPRHALDLVEAGKTVNVSVGWLENALWARDREQDPGAPRVRLPFARGGRRRVEVSPDDLVVAVVIP